MGSSFKFFGEGFAKNLITTTSNPIIGLFIGILATAIIQSSSTTTSMIVALVSAGVIELENAVPMVMGANIGTTVTNIIVSFAQITRKDEFEKGFSAAIVHDIFNLMMVFIFLPLELMTGLLRKSAVKLSSLIAGSANIEFHSPIKIIIKPVSKYVLTLIKSIHVPDVMHGIFVLLISLVLLFIALWLLVRIMKSIVIRRTEVTFNNIIGRAPILGIIAGTVFTMIIQSSSITTSIMVPLAGAGIVTLSTVFPITLGANIGTTFTALLASLAGNQTGLTIALVHFLFNFLSVVLIYPIPKIRNIPIVLSEKMGYIVRTNRNIALLYVLIIYFIIPGLAVFLTRIIK